MFLKSTSMKPAITEPDLLPPQFSGTNYEIPNIKSRIDEYKTFLIQISTGLGMSEMESNKILAEVCSQGNKDFANYPGTHSLKIWLSKIVVRKIIFKISTDLFNAQNREAQTIELGNYSPGNTIYDSRYKHMPLSLKVVYLLTRAGFSETEVSDILNVNPFRVRERLHKALAIVGD